MGPHTLSQYPAWHPPAGLPLVYGPASPCPYLPDQPAHALRGLVTDHMPARLYARLLDAGFRRSADLYYQPVCAGCRQCVPIRIPVSSFGPSRRQSRTLRDNEDLTSAFGPLDLTGEKLLLYQRYLAHRHHNHDATEDDLRRFLYQPTGFTAEITYRQRSDARLVAVSIVDIVPPYMSSVYCYFDPGLPRRRLGVYTILAEIGLARSAGLPYYHLGYWIEACSNMAYKADYRPAEVLRTDGRWCPLEPRTGHARHAPGGPEGELPTAGRVD